MTRAELLWRMSSREITEWMAFAQVEPFGAEFELLGHAVTASTFANANRKKGTKAFDVKDFIPKFREKKGTIKDLIGHLAAYTKAVGGKDKRE